MKNNRLSAHNILASLDKTSNIPAIPPFLEASFAGARLASYISRKEWVIAFQFVGFDFGSGIGTNEIFVFGNKIKSKKEFSREFIVKSSSKNNPYYPYFCTEVDEDISLFDLNDFSLEVRGEEKKFQVSTAEYLQGGIDLQSDKIRGIEKITSAIRYLCKKFPDLVFLNSDDLKNKIGRKKVTRFIELEEWHHPDFDSGEKFSENTCFQSLARAIEQKDASLFICEEFNTHWSNWTEYPDRFSR